MKIITLFTMISSVFSLNCYVQSDITNSKSLFKYKGGVYESAGYKHPAGNKYIDRIITDDLETFVNKNEYGFHLKSSKFFKDMKKMYLGELKDTCDPSTTTPDDTTTSPDKTKTTTTDQEPTTPDDTTTSPDKTTTTTTDQEPTTPDDTTTTSQDETTVEPQITTTSMPCVTTSQETENDFFSFSSSIRINRILLFISLYSLIIMTI